MSSPTQRLTGKIALVTGAARRVGKAIALELAAHGATLIVHHGNSDHDAEQTAAEIRALGGIALIIKADLRDPAAIDGLFAQIRASFGRVDILVNSASNFKSTPIMDISLDEWREVLDVNLTAPFLCSQHAARLMPDGGAIINIVDVSAFRPWKSFPHHSVSKSALKTLTEVLALNLGPKIRVNAIAPGPVLRDEGNSPAMWQRLGEKLPIGHTGDPSDVARAVIFLATEPFITGETLRVDGGDSIRSAQ